jgi:hypothetical protein
VARVISRRSSGKGRDHADRNWGEKRAEKNHGMVHEER